MTRDDTKLLVKENFSLNSLKFGNKEKRYLQKYIFKIQSKGVTDGLDRRVLGTLCPIFQYLRFGITYI